MTIVEARSQHLPALTELFCGYLRFYEVTRSREDVERFLGERLRLGDSTALLAFSAEEAVGFVHLYPLQSSLDLAPAWLLGDLFVAERARRSGVAQALMNAASDHARASGARTIMLETAKTNLAGQALYEKLGYVRDEVFYTYSLSL
ncbi:N-acetyltransferase family protein [Pseudomonas sp. LRF_L74]|uniref:GNAT family N-acetyltransferase n=1 Tax=Pseudomonas sp. LRF_L74 TaxID=3369422 RepID=UPI003F5F86FA